MNKKVNYDSWIDKERWENSWLEIRIKDVMKEFKKTKKAWKIAQAL